MRPTLHRDKTDTKPSESSSGNEQLLLSRGRLKSNAQVEGDRGGQDDTPTSTRPVGEQTCGKSTEEGTDLAIMLATFVCVQKGVSCRDVVPIE